MHVFDGSKQVSHFFLLFLNNWGGNDILCTTPRPLSGTQGQALPWLGVRVLELTRRTWTAPFAGRLMASCGAEARRFEAREEGKMGRGGSR